MDIAITRRHVVAASITVIVVGSAIGCYLLRPRPTPWLEYPTDGPAMVQRFLTLIQQDNRDSEKQAFKLVGLAQRKGAEENYGQVFHDMHRYLGLTTMFGDDWISHATITEMGNGAFEIEIGTEKLHIDVEPQGPPEGPVTNHLGIAGIREFPWGNGGKESQMAGINGFLKAEGGSQAVSNLQGIMAAKGNFSRFTPVQLKAFLLPAIQDTNNPDMIFAVLHLWPLRTDPTVIAHLRGIIGNQQYTIEVQRKATQVLEGTVPEEELVALGM